MVQAKAKVIAISLVILANYVLISLLFINRIITFKQQKIISKNPVIVQVQEQVDTNSRLTLLLEKFRSVRNQSVSLCEPLKAEDYVVQPIIDVSPPKWHLAHTTWFFEALILEEYNKNYQVFDADYGYMFNSYYESVGERVLRPNRGFMTRPTIDAVMDYRRHIDEHMEAFVMTLSDMDVRILDVLEIGLNHEQQHQELLLTDIKYILGHNPLFPAYKAQSKLQPQSSRASGFLQVNEGLYDIGHQSHQFCYDNELGVHKVYLQDFEVMDRLVTNGDYLEFIEAGGYQEFQWWYSEAWDWVNNNDIKAPHYWHKVATEWHSYTLSGFEKVDLSEPVTHVSQYEADAYARWKGLRLPTEFEWEIASRIHSPEIQASSNFVEDKRFGPTVKPEGNYQLYGDCWEWTNSSYLPYPYFKTDEGALGEYNGKFMINQMVLRGGSCATPRDHIRPTYRNFFHPHLRWQFTGIRLARHI